MNRVTLFNPRRKRLKPNGGRGEGTRKGCMVMGKTARGPPRHTQTAIDSKRIKGTASQDIKKEKRRNASQGADGGRKKGGGS